MEKSKTILCCLALSSPVVGQDTIFSDSFESPLPPPCVDQTAALVEWQNAWSSRNGRFQAVYPNSVSSPVAIGANKLFPTAIRWTPQGGEVINVYFEQVQANPFYGYNAPRPADSMTLAFSTCRGDFDVSDKCKLTGSSGSLLWHSDPDIVPGCYLKPGETAYLNVRVEACAPVANSQQGCDVQATHRSLR